MNEDKQQNEEKEHLGSEIRQYIEKRVQLISLTVAEHVSLVIAESFQKLAGILLLSSAVLFVWLALAFFLGEVLDHTAIGFLIASLPLFLAGMIFVNSKSRKITERIQGELIKKVMDELGDMTDNNQSNRENPPE